MNKVLSERMYLNINGTKFFFQKSFDETTNDGSYWFKAAIIAIKLMERNNVLKIRDRKIYY
ncbi:hypothetical protein ASG22_12940 [Chryseobacterium sp. Leaf405]|uniref:hypothetical protein n=1 Tax=Chryseobacterium sp. Leaf405 TaxID=1736367 RepID=UPI0006FFCCD2|nr:hypothetical protein [Chryseobacterium sp. Leaf405]KQT23280.1 hypothetical protein ASG22_12940 [Chryseobacterium sp. Leaf405]